MSAEFRCCNFSKVNEQPRLIAVVDDEESVRRALHRLLRSAGFVVQTHATGADFLQSLPDQRPDCLVLDLHMPVMNGFEVLERLKSSSLKMPTVIITGYDTTESRERAIQNGAVEFLRKPIDGQLLLDTIEAAITRSSA